jgi:hypothetical protein
VAQSQPKTPAEQRAELEDRLIAEGRDDLAAHLIQCRQVFPLRCLCCDDTFEVEKKCSRRWCPVCMPRISAKRLERVSRIVSRFEWPLSVCLTTENDMRAEGTLERMKEAVRGFRRTKFWTNSVKGGVMGLETHNKGKGWHTHPHMIVDCRWLAVATPEPHRGCSPGTTKKLMQRAHDELAETWGAYVQGRRASVFVKRLPRMDGARMHAALRETLKYSVKGSDLLKCKGSVAEIIDEIDRGRMITTFGHAHACSKEFVGIDEPEYVEKLCKKCSVDRSVLPEGLALDFLHGMRAPGKRYAALLEQRTESEDARQWGMSIMEWRAWQKLPEEDREDMIIAGMVSRRPERLK